MDKTHAKAVRVSMDWLKDNAASYQMVADWFDLLDSATDLTPLSLRAFMNNHDVLDTLQVTLNNNLTKVSKVWAPRGREIDSSHASYVTLDGSRRSYAGVVHIAHGEGVWVGYNADWRTLIAYSTI